MAETLPQLSPIEQGYQFELEVWDKSSKGITFPCNPRSFRSALRAAMHNQEGWNPFNPRPCIAYILRWAIMEELERCDIWPERVALYRTVGQEVDIVHGIDGVVDINGTLITIDTTTNPRKDNKADVIFFKRDATPLRIHYVTRDIVHAWFQKHERHEVFDELEELLNEQNSESI